MVKERYKDDSLDITDAGEKVKALINEHLIDLGINPKIPPIELLSDDFMAHVRKHSQGDPEAKASEMEHAIRKHCTIHFDEDPAFYKRLSDKLEKLILEHKNNWQALAEGYEALRKEALAGRTDVVEGLSKEATTFYDYVVQIAFDGQRDAAGIPAAAEKTDDADRRDSAGHNRHHRLLEEADRGKETARQHRHGNSSGEYPRA